MKILFCIPTLEYGGAERQLCYLAEELTRMGHEIHVALTRRGAHYARMIAVGRTRPGGDHDNPLLKLAQARRHRVAVDRDDREADFAGGGTRRRVICTRRPPGP